MPITRATARPRRSARHVGWLIFTVVSLLVALQISQEETPEIGSIAYWVLLGTAAVLPLLDFDAITKTLLGRGQLLLLFCAMSGAWHLLRGDGRAALQLALIVWILVWLSTNRMRVRVIDIERIYLAAVAFGALIWASSDLNRWGLIPGTTAEEYGVWRVAFSSSIAISAMFSLAVVLVLTRSATLARRHWLATTVALYFLIFSFVRTALIGLILYAATYWWFRRRRHSARTLFWTALLIGVGINALIASSTVMIEYVQHLPFVARFLLRDETGLSAEQIYQQLYRPWLWGQHLSLFLHSPSLMGWGVFELVDVQTEVLLPGTTPMGNEALLTRLLASYGLPALLFVAYLLSCLRKVARERDAWACACFPVLLLLLMQWGSVFHPTDAVGALFFMMLVRGAKAFIGCDTVRPTIGIR